MAAIVLTLTGCALATKAPPLADAGTDVAVHMGEIVSLDGSASTDLDGGKIMYYRWSIRFAPEEHQDEVGRVLGEGADAAVCATDLAMSEDNLGQWTIELKVTDDEGESALDEMVLTVIP